VKVFVYMDSDAVISRGYANTSFISLLSFMATRLQWDPTEKPMVFNQVGGHMTIFEKLTVGLQDGPCWWCNLILKVGYTMCLNAGTVLWYRHDQSQKVLMDWWHSTMESYADNPLKRSVLTLELK
jgi:hypothetical protein